jgi:choline dehydrogenase-like flavoprotein
MLIDYNNLPKTSQIKQYDVCIVGAGPAGITIARVLASKGKRIALFEGGDLNYSEESQSLYDGKSIGLNDWDAVRNCRLRYFGGTSNHWAGMCGLFDEVDFHKRPNDMSGWPISKLDVFKHFDEAKKILDLPENAFIKNEHWDGKHFRPYLHSFSPPTRFNQKYIDELKRSNKIDLYINANLTKISLESNLRDVKSLEITSYKKTTNLFSAKSYVLAMGSLENARMLLANNKQIKTGIGNHSDFVGRCYMEHFNVEYGRFVVDNPKFWNRSQLLLSVKEDLISKLNIGSAVLTFEQNIKTTSYGHTAKLKQSLRNLVCQSESATELSRKLVDFNCDGDGVVTSMIEQSPNLDSRVTLDSKVDQFGIQRIVHNWKYNDYDSRTIRTLGFEVAKEMAVTGAARLQLNDFILDKSLPIETSHHCHQMGTTRMSALPKDGVVDENSKVHHLNNLYIAGSSVYPTGGGCNPTFTLVMLSLRLGHYLDQKLG